MAVTSHGEVPVEPHPYFGREWVTAKPGETVGFNPGEGIGLLRAGGGPSGLEQILSLYSSSPNLLITPQVHYGRVEVLVGAWTPIKVSHSPGGSRGRCE